MGNDEAFVTLATNDNYCLGAMVLGHSMRNVKTTKQLVVLVTPTVSQDMRKCLAKAYDLVQEVDVMHSKERKILEVMKRPELSITLTKLHCWRLTQFKKCVFMDADTLPLKNIDELFEREELSAVCDIGWPDCFNTGLFVFRPSETTFAKLCTLASESGSFDGGDQGLLNTYFSDWATSDISKHLSFIYNMSSVATYSYPAAYARFGDQVKVVHFLGSLKPWMYAYNAQTKKVLPPPVGSHAQQLEHVQKWWDIFIRQVQPSLTPDCAAEYTHFEQEYRDGVDPFQESHQDINNNQALEMSVQETDDEVDDEIFEIALQQENAATIEGSNEDDRLTDDEINSKPPQQPMENIITSSSSSSDETEFTKIDKNELPIALPSSQDASKRKKAWEKGSMDYLGVDRFDNIQRKLDQAIGHLTDSLGQHEPESRSSSSPSCYIESKKCSGTYSLDISMGLASQLAKLNLDSSEASLYPGTLGGGTFFDDYSRKRAWESGTIDYMGADSFENIQKKLDQAIGKPQFVLDDQESANGQCEEPNKDTSTVESTSDTNITTTTTSTATPTLPTEEK